MRRSSKNNLYNNSVSPPHDCTFPTCAYACASQNPLYPMTDIHNWLHCNTSSASWYVCACGCVSPPAVLPYLQNHIYYNDTLPTTLVRLCAVGDQYSPTQRLTQTSACTDDLTVHNVVDLVVRRCARIGIYPSEEIAYHETVSSLATAERRYHLALCRLPCSKVFQRVCNNDTIWFQETNISTEWQKHKLVDLDFACARKMIRTKHVVSHTFWKHPLKIANTGLGWPNTPGPRKSCNALSQDRISPDFETEHYISSPERPLENVEDC